MTEAPAVLDRPAWTSWLRRRSPTATGWFTRRSGTTRSCSAELDSGAQLAAGRGVGVSPRPYRLRVAVLARPAGRSRASSYRLGLQRPALPQGDDAYAESAAEGATDSDAALSEPVKEAGPTRSGSRSHIWCGCSWLAVAIGAVLRIRTWLQPAALAH